MSQINIITGGNAPENYNISIPEKYLKKYNLNNYYRSLFIHHWTI
ncbi:hypothetical protein ACI8B_250079 [Acinetobacter proteolyticus]|uniref:Uncharacterized protein n=1 Tax=Acinetobacter proteolyticus TaxID=1776741 RepID=A0A653K545_9GAMM|nr:hypothetical protein ACI8B_250079 [Acinetobacter proteolyticus]